MIFTVAQSVFCIAGMFGGFTAQKINSKKTLWISAVTTFIGCVGASFTDSLLIFSLTFGIFAGFGMGLIYNAIVRTVVRWFPEKSGFISGLLLMGFGMSAFFVGKLYQAFTPSYIGGWRVSFRFIGISAAIVLFIVSQFILEPDPEDLPVSSSKSASVIREDEFIGDLSPSQVIRNPAFLIFFIYLFGLSVCGAALTSQATGIAMEVAPAMDGAAIATIVGMMPFANGIGRVVTGFLNDKIRPLKTTIVSCAGFFFSTVLLMIALKTGSVPVMVAGFIVGGFGFGTLGPTNSAYAMTRFGVTYYAINFAFLNANGVPSSMAATAIGALYDMTGTYHYPLLVLCGCTIAAFLLRTLLAIHEKSIHAKK